MVKRLIALLMMLLLMPLAVGASVDYSREFALEGQQCSVADTFNYVGLDSTFSSGTIYSCCDQHGMCEELVFDSLNKRELKRGDIFEIINARYVYEQINSGRISPDLFVIDTSGGLCQYFGFDVFGDELINLAAEGEQYVRKYVSDDAKRAIKAAKKYGKSAGKITKFSPGTFVVSIACIGMNKREESIVFKIAECKQYFELLKNKNTYYGLNINMNVCVREAKTGLNEYVNSDFYQVKDSFDKVSNTISGLVSWAMEDPIKSELTIEESTYETFKRTHDKLSSFDANLEDAGALVKTDRAIGNMERRKTDVFGNIALFESRLKQTKVKRPNRFFEFFRNILMKPNRDFSEADALLTIAKARISQSESFGKAYMFSSASELFQLIESDINNARAIIDSQLQVKQVTFFGEPLELK